MNRSAPLICVVALALGCAAPAQAQHKPRAASPKSHRSSTPADDAPDIVTYGRRDDVMRFADELAARRQLDPAWVRATLENARFVPSVARLVMPPPSGTAKNWAAYRARFIEPVRVKAGLAFWRDNARWLKTAEAVYGVPAEIVVGIVGVETIYGRQMGSYRVIDALATLAFDFPAGRKDRSEFFRSELESYFVLCHGEGVDPLAWRGSYAGAIGMAQFMPSSFTRYAVDLDGDGHVDLHRSSADVIGSVARYLAEFGWVRDLPTRIPVRAPVDGADRAALLEPDIVPTFSTAELSARGAAIDPEAAASVGNARLALIELQNGGAAPSYVAGTANFYAITRYNWSSYYAMAVIELGAAVRRERERSTASP